MTTRILILAAILVACGTPKPNTDTTATLVIDTVKPAGNSMSSADPNAVPAPRVATPVTKTKTKSGGTKSGSTKAQAPNEKSSQTKLRDSTTDPRRIKKVPIDTTRPPA